MIAANVHLGKLLFSSGIIIAFTVGHGIAERCGAIRISRLESMEGSMKRAFYKVERYEDKWVVVACRQKILVCKTKKMAIELTRRAACMMRHVGLSTHEKD
jgi:hypothetical protein